MTFSIYSLKYVAALIETVKFLISLKKKKKIIIITFSTPLLELRLLNITKMHGRVYEAGIYSFGNRIRKDARRLGATSITHGCRIRCSRVYGQTRCRKKQSRENLPWLFIKELPS